MIDIIFQLNCVITQITYCDSQQIQRIIKSVMSSKSHGLIDN